MHIKSTEPEQVLRLPEFARRVGYQVSTIRKKLFNGEISYMKPGRIIVIPESEVARFLGRVHKAVSMETGIEK